MARETDLYPDLEYCGNGLPFAEDLLELFTQGSLYEPMSREDCTILSRHMHCFVAPGEYALLQQGEAGDFLLVIMSGHVRVMHNDLLGRPLHIADVGSGGVLGEMSIIDGEQRVASCITNNTVRFSVLTRRELNDILYSHPRLANKFLIWVLQSTVVRLRELTLRSVGKPME